MMPRRSRGGIPGRVGDVALEPTVLEQFALGLCSAIRATSLALGPLCFEIPPLWFCSAAKVESLQGTSLELWIWR